jgi:hypothetical protein
VLAARVDPYFNRAWNHFCSHLHTPDNKTSEFPAVTKCDQVIYFAHHIFTRYRLYGQPLYRDFVKDAISMLLPEVDFPTAGRVSLMQQENENRYIIHLLYATPVLRGGRGGENARAVEVIEDIVPLYEVHCKVRVPETVHAARLAPSGEDLKFILRDDVLEFCVPHLRYHQMVVLEYKSTFGRPDF